MNKYAVSYYHMIDCEIKALVVDANNEVEAMSKAILEHNPSDVDMKEWIDEMSGCSHSEFKSNLLDGEIAVDAVVIEE